MRFTQAITAMKNGTLKKKIGTNTWEVDEAFIWYLVYTKDKKLGAIFIPKGFTTDFGSIPQFLWSFFNPTKYVSYILHDYLYSNKNKYKLISRRRADKILREALKVEGMNFIKRNLVYLGVRLFGFLFFRKDE